MNTKIYSHFYFILDTSLSAIEKQLKYFSSIAFRLVLPAVEENFLKHSPLEDF